MNTIKSMQDFTLLKDALLNDVSGGFVAHKKNHEGGKGYGQYRRYHNPGVAHRANHGHNSK